MRLCHELQRGQIAGTGGTSDSKESVRRSGVAVRDIKSEQTPHTVVGMRRDVKHLPIHEHLPGSGVVETQKFLLSKELLRQHKNEQNLRGTGLLKRYVREVVVVSYLICPMKASIIYIDHSQNWRIALFTLVDLFK